MGASTSCKPCCKAAEDGSPEKATIMKGNSDNEDEEKEKEPKKKTESIARTTSMAGDASDNSKKIRFLGKVPLFNTLDEDLLGSILSACEEKKFADGEDVFKQGEDGSDLFVIIKGEAQVYTDGKKVAKLKAGDYFGESGLLKAVPRTATIKAVGKLLTIMLTQAAFDTLGLKDRVLMVEKALDPPKLKKASSKLERKNSEAAPDRNKKVKFLGKVPLFYQLNNDVLTSILDACAETKFNDGQEIFKQGEAGSDLFVIIKGECHVYVDGAKVAELKAGDYFGESGLMKTVPRTATVKAAGKVLTIMLSKVAFEELGLHNTLSIVEKATSQQYWSWIAGSAVAQMTNLSFIAYNYTSKASDVSIIARCRLTARILVTFEFYVEAYMAHVVSFENSSSTNVIMWPSMQQDTLAAVALV